MNLIITLDYELFGDGSGNVFKHIVNPTNKLLELCKKNNIKITIFFEIIEYLKLKEIWDSGINMGYQTDPCKAIEDQIKTAYKQGHDIQLHLHPQWIDAKYENKWILDDSLWRLPNVNKENCGYSISELLKQGKKTIEQIINPIDSNYKCNILRSGGYNLQPSGEIINAMKENDFIVDSSVCPGCTINSDFSKFDYSNLKNNIPFWWIKNGDVMNISSDKKDILEIPVFALPVKKYQKYDIQRLKIRLKNKQYTKEQIKYKLGNESLFDKIRYFFKNEVITWDYSLFNKNKMNSFFKMAEEISNNSSYKNHSFVLIGHSKEMYYFEVIQYLFNIAKKNNVNFIRMNDFVKMIN